MPLAALRLVNPPRRGRKKNPSVRAVRTPTGTRYLKKVGSRWQFTSAPKANPGRRSLGEYVTTNPPKRRRRKKTNPRFSAGKARLKRGVKKLAVAGGKKATSKSLKLRKARRRRKSIARGIVTPKRKRTTKKRITKRAASPRKRRSTVAKKRTSGPRRPTRKVKARRKMKALWAKARRMGRKSIKGVKLGGAGPKRRRRKATKRRAVSANPRRRKIVRRVVAKARRRRRTNPWVVVKKTRKTHVIRHTKRPKRKYRLVATRRKRFSPRLVSLRNPMGTIKRVLPIYGGFLAARVLSGLFRHYVTPKLGMSAEVEAKYGPLIPAGAIFLFSTLLAPKIKPLARNAKLMEGLKIGSAFALFNVIVKQFVVPALPATGPMATIKSALGGYDDVGVRGYGLGAYIADPSGYSLPPHARTAEPGVGLDVHEAMALDEYVADAGMGYDVSEVLAGTEIDYMQRGGAGGSLSKTVFTD